MPTTGMDTTLRSISFLPPPISVEDSTLQVVSGPHQGQQLALNKEVTIIGRAEWCDLVLDKDPKVSSRHCQIIVDEKGARVLDQQSSNGTCLGDQQIIEAYLKPGVPLQIGDSIIELTVNQSKKKKIFLRYQTDSGSLVGRSEKMRRLFDWMERIGPRDTTVLLTGETGTGKTQIARAIHKLSGRKGAFIEVNCGALPAHLIEGLLFGFTQGAFTGASKSHEGFFQQADGGTLFLDEIAELPLDLQPKLLSVLESRSFRKIGGKEDLTSNFRLITATHRQLPEAIQQGQFRQDLYFRIHVVKLEVPPLRERVEDIPLLCAAILNELQAQHLEVSHTAIRALQEYLWPGNVRELRSVLERCVVFLEDGIIEAGDLFFDFAENAVQESSKEKKHPLPFSSSIGIEPERLTGQESGGGDGGKALAAEAPSTQQAMLTLMQAFDGASLQSFIDHMESAFLQYNLHQQGSVQEAARHLDVSRGLIYKRIHKYSLKLP